MGNIDIKNGKVAREVTDEEVAFYDEHGWVKLDGLIAPEVVVELLEAGKKLKETIQTAMREQKPDGDASQEWRTVSTPDWKGAGTMNDSSGLAYASGGWLDARKIRLDPFLSFNRNKSLGRVVQRLMNRHSLTEDEVGVRYIEDALLFIGPTDAPLADPNQRISDETRITFHQDHFGLDRKGGFNLWIALDQVTSGQTMRFLDKSHLEGPLGLGPTPLLERYAKLMQKYAWSPPFEYKPGDATVHHEFMVHGGARATTKARWAYVPTFAPADCVLVDEKTSLGYADPNERFPIVYP